MIGVTVLAGLRPTFVASDAMPINMNETLALEPIDEAKALVNSVQHERLPMSLTDAMCTDTSQAFFGTPSQHPSDAGLGSLVFDCNFRPMEVPASN